MQENEQPTENSSSSTAVQGTKWWDPSIEASSALRWWEQQRYAQNGDSVNSEPGKGYIILPREELEAMIDARTKQEGESMEAVMDARIAQALDTRSKEEPNPQQQEQFVNDIDAENKAETKELLGVCPLEEANEEETEWHSPFGESVYTLFYMYDFTSQSFLYSVFVYGVQMATIILTLIDIAPKPVPPMVDLTVTCAQGLTIFLLLANMSDLIDATLKLQAGFYPEVLCKHPGANYSTWIFSCMAQLLAGLFLLAASFVLTMQSSTVIELMLNLTALVFMAEIDDIGFSMAKLGFLTDRLQIEADAVANFEVPKRKRHNTPRRVLYSVALIVLYTLFAVVKVEQLEGKYLPTYVYVQFGDAYNPKIPFFSGILTSGNAWTALHREYQDLETGNITLGYCLEEKSWTFSDVNDACNYFAKSYETDSYDVTALHNSQWEVKDSIGRLQPFDSFSLVSRDCDAKTCQGTCGEDGLCGCPHNRFGMDCEFVGVCPDLLIDERFDPFPPIGIIEPNGLKVFGFSDEFHLLLNLKTQKYVRVYNMPVYYSNKTYPANIIFFGGRRWVLTTEWDLFDLAETERLNPNTFFFQKRTVSILENNFHGYYHANYTPFYISDPVDFQTPDFQPTPESLRWWTVQKGDAIRRDFVPDVPINTYLTCHPPPQSCVDQPDDFCFNGECNTETGLCTCWFGFSGDTCDLALPCYDWIIPCSGNGICDESSGLCGCNFPFYGLNCEIAHKCYEAAGECKSGGVCNQTTGSCDCPIDPAISGVACEKRTDCAIFGCANGGVCGPNGACICRQPFYGTDCSLVNSTSTDSFCSIDDDCVNGICNIVTGMCECNDPSSYGPLCEHRHNCSMIEDQPWHPRPVSLKGCLNSGVCDESSGLCDCPAPFFGPDCSQIPPCSTDDDCGGVSSGGLCMDEGFCKCPYGPAQGRQCENKLECTSDGDCYNGGTCDTLRGICKCHSTGLSGALCDSFTVSMYDPTFDKSQLEVEEYVRRCSFDEDPTCEPYGVRP